MSLTLVLLSGILVSYLLPAIFSPTSALIRVGCSSSTAYIFFCAGKLMSFPPLCLLLSLCIKLQILLALGDDSSISVGWQRKDEKSTATAEVKVNLKANSKRL